MWVTANVKWYVWWNAWGVYEPVPSLLTYEEIVAMANTEWHPWTNTIAELNTNPEAYYNMLNNWWHLNDDVHIEPSSQPQCSDISWYLPHIDWIKYAQSKMTEYIIFATNCGVRVSWGGMW